MASHVEATIVPVLKLGKDPKSPFNYLPIALTSCLCKTFECMVNVRLVYVLENDIFRFSRVDSAKKDQF